MAESALSLRYQDLLDDVCNYLGYNTTYPPASPDQQALCVKVVYGGLKRFYYPKIPQSLLTRFNQRAWVWTFLRPVTSAYTFVGTATATLGAIPTPGGGATTIVTVTAANYFPGVAVNRFLVFVPSGRQFKILQVIGGSQVLVEGNAIPEATTGAQLAIGADGSISAVDNQTLTATGVPSWATLGVVAGDVVSIYGVPWAATHMVESVSGGNLVVDTALGGNGACSYTVYRAPTMRIDHDGNYLAPDDWGGIYGQVTCVSSDGRRTPVLIVNEQRLRGLQREQDGRGRTTVLAVRPLKVGDSLAASFGREATIGQRWMFEIHPKPDQLYNLSYRYIVLPQIDKISFPSGYPYGGMIHSETLRESCLAQAELEVREIVDGPHAMAFAGLLERSLMVDLEAYEPEHLGYNGNCETASPILPIRAAGRVQDGGTIVTYNG